MIEIGALRQLAGFLTDIFDALAQEIERHLPHRLGLAAGGRDERHELDASRGLRGNPRAASHKRGRKDSRQRAKLQFQLHPRSVPRYALLANDSASACFRSVDIARSGGCRERERAIPTLP